MHREMMYYPDDERAAAAERQMGCSSCSPFGTIISRAIKGRSNGRQGGRSRKETLDYDAMAYPTAQTYYVRPNARTITVTANNNASASHHAVPPQPTTRAYAMASAPPRASGGASNKPRKKKKKKRVAFAPDAAGAGPMSGNAPSHAGHAPLPPPHAGHAPRHEAVVAPPSSSGGSGGVYHMPQGAAEPYSFPPAPPAGQYRQGGHAYGYGYGYCSRYAPSPLTRWDVAPTPRRHEYFSGEYRWYYPTPVRESIYSFATDANHRLTATFSEENPNACVIF